LSRSRKAEADLWAALIADLSARALAKADKLVPCLSWDRHATLEATDFTAMGTIVIVNVNLTKKSVAVRINLL
jgi:hypothetical protein